MFEYQLMNLYMNDKKALWTVILVTATLQFILIDSWIAYVFHAQWFLGKMVLVHIRLILALMPHAWSWFSQQFLMKVTPMHCLPIQVL